MHVPEVNIPAVLVAGVLIFVLGGLWYSPLLFAKRWVALMNRSEEELKASAPGPVPYVLVFLCGIATAWTLAVILNHFDPVTPLRGALVGLLCWIGFAGSTSFGSATFSMTPRPLWFINSAYNLISFMLAGLLLAVWR